MLLSTEIVPSSEKVDSRLTTVFSTHESTRSENHRKFALIIAISHYPKSGGWPTIDSDHDVALINTALLHQGFLQENIRLLEDQFATKIGIENAVNRLTAEAQSGDVVVIHYSGHGQQIEDDNGDEIDGLDECLVPFDAPMRAGDEYHGEKHLRDDEFGEMIDRLREKCGKDGNVVAIVDACYSGTITRGEAPSRGGPILVSSTFKPPSVKNNEAGGLFQEGKRSRGDGTDERLAPFVLFSASNCDEPNYEARDEKGNWVGSLSLGISRVLAKARKGLTYRGAFDLMTTEMQKLAPRQTPQIEGNVDQQLFGGSVVDQVPYVGIDEVANDSLVRLQSGTLLGIFKNSIVEFHPIGTLDPKKSTPIAKGVVSDASELSSDVVLRKPASSKKLKLSWAFVTEQGFGDMKVKVSLNKVQDTDLKNSLENELARFPLVELANTSADLIVESDSANNQITVRNAGDNTMFLDPISASVATLPEEIKERVKLFVRSSFLRSLDVSSSDMDVTFEVVPVTVENMNGKPVIKDVLDISTKRTVGNQYEFKEGDRFILKVRNRGRTPAYFSILDISSDGKIGLMIPPPKTSPGEYKVKPDDSINVQGIGKITKPYGVEVMKLIATAKPVNFEPIVTSRGENTATARGEMNPLENLLQDSFVGRRSAFDPIPTGSFSTHTFTFKVMPVSSQ